MPPSAAFRTFRRALRLPDGSVMDADVLLRHAEEEVRKIDAQEERKIVRLPVHVQEVQQAGLHTRQGRQKRSVGSDRDQVTVHALSQQHFLHLQQI